jgi:hypothetical protein
VPGARKQAPPVEESERFCNGLVFSPPGHGKTVLLGTAALDKRTSPIALLDFEGGVLDVLTGLPGQGKDWVHIPIHSWDDLNKAFERLYHNEEGFKAVGIDSLSEIHIFALMNILDRERQKREDRGQEVDAIQQPDYGIALVQIRRLVREFRDLPMHTFFTAQSKDEVDSRLGMVKMVSMAGKAAVEIPGLLTLVGYLAVEQDEEGKEERILLLRNFPKIMTKVRTPWGVEAPEEIREPTISKILDVLHY